jgi:hypothetical protein
MAKLMMGCGENEQIVLFYFILFFVHCFFGVHCFFCVQKKKQKKTNVHLFYFVLFVYTNIKVNNFPLCEKALSLACVGFSI